MSTRARRGTRAAREIAERVRREQRASEARWAALNDPERLAAFRAASAEWNRRIAERAAARDEQHRQDMAALAEQAQRKADAEWQRGYDIYGW